MPFTSKKRNTIWLVVTLTALVAFLAYYFWPRSNKETCPDGSSIPASGDCSENYKKDSNGNPIVPAAKAPDANGCVQPSRYTTNSFPLAIGMQGALVKQLQTRLNSDYKAKLSVDGKFGCKTANALKNAWNIATVTSQFFIDNVAADNTTANSNYVQVAPIDPITGCDANNRNAIGVDCNIGGYQA